MFVRQTGSSLCCSYFFISRKKELKEVLTFKKIHKKIQMMHIIIIILCYDETHCFTKQEAMKCEL